MPTFSVLSWNVQGKINFTGHTFFRKIRPYLLNSKTDIIILQEFPKAEKKLKSLPTLAGYHAVIPPKGSDNANLILSKYPIVSWEEIIYPKIGKINFENSLRADILVDSKILRIYNCHFEVFRVGMATRLKQLEFILNDAKKHNGPIIVCGDLNATIPKAGLKRNIIRLWHQKPKQEMKINGQLVTKDEREVFMEAINKFGFLEVLDLYTPTWSPVKSELWEMFKLKLDWFMVKNIAVQKKELGNYISDHRSVKVECSI